MNKQIPELLKILSEMGISVSDKDIKIDIPEDPHHGDYTSNIALTLFGKLETRNPKFEFKNPRQLAENIIEKLQKIKDSMFEKVEVAGPGFINFFVSKKALEENLKQVLEKKDLFGYSDRDAGKKIMVEFTDPNPFKEFHIGHLYSNAVGESFARLYEYSGAEVQRACYQGDVGLHVAKALWGFLKLVGSKQLTVDSMESWTLSEQAKFLGESYALGAKEYEENEAAKNEINELNKTIYQKTDEKINDLYEKGRRWSLDYFESLYTRLGTRFDHYYFESQMAEIGMAIIEQHIGDVFEKSDNAVIFPGKKYGLHNRVFINSLGLPTYEAKEMALAPTKYKDFPYDLSIVITGNEVNDYFAVVLKALSMIEPELSEKTQHIGHGMVKLPEGKMSSRTGNVVTGEWLIDEAKRVFKENYPEMEEATVEKVAVAAIKYAFLKSGVGSDLSFSFQESIDLHGNSGPYLQYTAVRTQSILRKSDPAQRDETNLNIQNSKLEIEEELLLRTLIHFPEICEEAAARHAPNLVCSYLFDLAQKFNLFYQKHSVLGTNQSHGEDVHGMNNEIRNFRLALTAAVGQTMKNGLFVLGIPVPEKM